jgi:DNA transposition AAA+ family ATPase
MSDKSQASNTGMFAPITNLGLAKAAFKRAIERPAGAPGIVAFYGPSGLGKTVAASYCANSFQAAYTECRSFTTKKSLLQALALDMGIRPGRTIPELFEQVAEQLRAARKPVIIDEADYIATNKVIELVRDLHSASGAAVLLIGEENLPSKLQQFERFHNRVLVWQQAQLASPQDVKRLVEHYASKIEIAEDLLAAIVDACRHNTRRIVTNLENVRDICTKKGVKAIDLAAWGDEPFYTGNAPARRAA